MYGYVMNDNYFVEQNNIISFEKNDCNFGFYLKIIIIKMSVLNLIRSASIKVYRALGSGHTELAYTRALKAELCKTSVSDADFHHEFDKRLKIRYDGNDVGYVIPDLVINDGIPVELKAKRYVTTHDVSQLSKYMRLLKNHVGILVNFTQHSRHRCIGDTRMIINPGIQLYSVVDHSNGYYNIISHPPDDGPPVIEKHYQNLSTISSLKEVFEEKYDRYSYLHP